MLLNIYLLIQSSYILCAFCAPTNSSKETNATEYSFENYDEIYDQRQNGTENYKVNVNGVVIAWASPEDLLVGAHLLYPALFEGEYPDVGEILNPQKPEKPEDLILVQPDKPNVNTTTNSPSNTTENIITSSSTEQLPELLSNTIQIKQENVKRRFRLPGFMKPFVTRRIIQQ